jgi:hypothetical protein
LSTAEGPRANETYQRPRDLSPEGIGTIVRSGSVAATLGGQTQWETRKLPAGLVRPGRDEPRRLVEETRIGGKPPNVVSATQVSMTSQR